MIRRPIRRLLTASLWVLLLIYALGVIHDFFTYVDRAIYVSIDDGEAAIAYALATTGRYAFFPSPVLFGMSRLHGQFNYGPWYFYAAAAAVKIFGFSLTLVRSLHLWVIVGCAGAAAWWFRGRDRAAVPVLFGLALLYFFDALEWPMVRPDSFVSAFAVVLVIAAGLGWQRGQARWWFVAGLAAACGAFTHLIAVGLLPAAVVLFAWAAANRKVDAYRGGVALAAGLAAGAFMFYASFGFDIAGQWRFLNGYRDLTATSDGYVEALRRHFKIAFVETPVWLQASVGVSIAAAWLTVVVAAIRRMASRDLVFAYVLPPAAVWTFYIAGIGKYTNYHAGYGILHHVMFLWTVCALLWVWMQTLQQRHPFTSAAVSTLAMLLVLGLGVRELRRLSAAPGFASRAEHRVAFTDYSSRVLAGVPAGAPAWGTVFFGMESPDRIQLLQHDDATAMAGRLPQSERALLRPDFLIWGYPEVRDDTLTVLNGGANRLAGVRQLLPDARFRLAGLVDGSPYGVTRIYARDDGSAPAPPSVAVYDEVHDDWLDRISAPRPDVFAPAMPVTLRIGYEAAPMPRTATSSVAADLPPGHYLLKITLRPGHGDSPRLIAVTPWTMTTQTVQQLGLRPRGDFAGYLSGDREVYAVSAHPGGTLYVSQFDAGEGSAIESVLAMRLSSLRERGPEHMRALPDFTHWIPMPGVRMLLRHDGLLVDGDDSVGGYQLYSSVINANPGEFTEVDAPSAVVQGEICAGILNARGEWLVPAIEWRRQFDFRADRTGGFRVALANCQSHTPPVQSRFRMTDGTYSRDVATFADRAFGMSFEGRSAEQFVPASDKAVRYPAQPRVVLQPQDIDFRAPSVRGSIDAWRIEGAAAASSELLRSKFRYVDAETRLLVSGNIERGAITVALTGDAGDPEQIRVAGAGRFTAIMAPRERGMHALRISSAGDAGVPLAITLDRVDWVPPMRPAK
jgi:hypothetical protein